MPRFFFHVHDGQDLPDDVGIELPDLDAARREAVRYSGALLGDSAKSFWDGDDWRMEVQDESGLTLFELHFMAVSAPAAKG